MLKSRFTSIVSFIQEGKIKKTKTALKRFREDFNMLLNSFSWWMRQLNDPSSQISREIDDPEEINADKEMIADLMLLLRSIKNIRRVCKSVYGKEIALNVNKHCTKLYKELPLTGKQWNTIFQKFGEFITADAFNKRKGNTFQYDQVDLINKISSLYKVELDKHFDELHAEELQQQLERIAYLEAQLADLDAQLAARSPDSSQSGSFEETKAGIKRLSSSSSSEDLSTRKRQRTDGVPDEGSSDPSKSPSPR